MAQATINTKVVARQLLDIERLIRAGVRAAKHVAVNARVATLRAYIGGGNPAETAAYELLALQPIFYDGMVAGHLAGRLRSYLTAAAYLRRAQKPFGPYDAALDFLKKRMDLSEGELLTLQQKYGDTALNVTRITAAGVEQRIKQATDEIIAQGMHVRQGTQHLRQAFDAAGVNAAHPWLCETLVRTQIDVAYNAGRWNANQDPDINSILWGYQYHTIGDIRVRKNHQGLHGTKLPKDHPLWQSIWPPNGFNCRCKAIEIYNEDAPADVTLPSPVDDVPPVPDKDFAVNHGMVYGDMVGVKDIADVATGAPAVVPIRRNMVDIMTYDVVNKVSPLGGGVNETEIVENDFKGVFKPADGEEAFRNGVPKGEAYKREVAAYKIDKHLDTGVCPVTVERTVKGRVGSVQQWHDGDTFEAMYEWGDVSLKDTKKAARVNAKEMAVFDFITGQTDRHCGNAIYVKATAKTPAKVWAIDNGYAMQDWALLQQTGTNFDNLYSYTAKEIGGQKINKKLMAKIDNFIANEDTIRKELAGDLAEGAIDGIFIRAKILKGHGLIPKKGDSWEFVYKGKRMKIYQGGKLF